MYHKYYGTDSRCSSQSCYSPITDDNDVELKAKNLYYLYYATPHTTRYYITL